MTPTAAQPPPLLYVDCDVPEGLTLVEWRRRREGRRVRRSRVVRLLRRVRRVRH
jgi:hypothetical protein